MRAIILSGGRGTRLEPYTLAFPKPLVPVGEIPIVEIIVRQLRFFGFRRATLAVGYLSELLRAYFQNHASRFTGIEIDYIYEDAPTGTAGALANIEGLDRTFLVMNGDVLTTLDYARLVAHHAQAEAALTICSYRKGVKIDLGVIERDSCGYVTEYLEKPQFDYIVSMGIYVYEPRVLEFIPRGRYFDFPDLVRRLVAEGERVSTFVWDGYWLDMGRPEDFQMAADEFARHRKEFHVEIE
jgi:NDP-mannose synthase